MTFYVREQNVHLVATEYQGASLEYQSLQFLQPGVTPMTCDPPQLPQEVSGECLMVGLVQTPEEATNRYMVFSEES